MIDTPAPKKKEFLVLVVFVVCMLVFVARAVTSLVQESSTWDETHYFGLGKYLLKEQRWDVPGSILHPPLSYYVHSVPLLFSETDEQVWKESAKKGNRGFMDILRGQNLLSSRANDGDRLLILSRVMMVLVAVLLGYYVMSWSYQLYGKWSAICAVLLYSFCPNILAHARLITPDILLTTFTFITVYYWWRLLREQRMADGILGGVSLGLALLSKYTAVLLLPICLCLAALWWMKKKPLSLSRCVLFFVVGGVVLLLGYGLQIEPFIAGIEFQQAHAKRGHASFLFGEYAWGGQIEYFVLAFLVKMTTPVLVLLLITGVMLLKKIREGAWLNEAFLLVPAIAVFVFFSFQQQNTGLRYILPILPFLFVFASDAVRRLSLRKVSLSLAVLLMAWHAGASLYIHPHYLAYFNELVGGPRNGYRYLVDSNLDWGQDLKRLKQVMTERGIEKVHLSYFGTDAPERYGINYEWLPSFVLRNLKPDVAVTNNPKGWVAISATNLQGIYLQDRNLFAEFRKRQPVEKIGYSIFLYYIE